MSNKKINIITLILVLIFVAALGYALLSDDGFIVSQENVHEDQIIALPGDLPELEVIGKAPELRGIADWINSEPLTLESLRGKVVLVDFWTYSCINCIRTLPHVGRWYEAYKEDGFVVLGVHSPEFEFEKEKANVLESVGKYKLTYPVALDNDHATWNAFQNRYWPAHYIIDVEGNIRYTHFGEGRYAETESAIQALLLEGGLLSLEKFVTAEEPVTHVDFQQIGTPEIYFGASRINNFGSSVEGIAINKPYTFPEPLILQPNTFYLTGTWRVDLEFAEFVGDKGKISLQYLASNVNMVLDAAIKEEVLLEVKLDGNPLQEHNKGEDVFLENGKSFVKVTEARLYNIVDMIGDYSSHDLEIFVSMPGLQAFTFTFG